MNRKLQLSLATGFLGVIFSHRSTVFIEREN